MDEMRQRRKRARGRPSHLVDMLVTQPFCLHTGGGGQVGGQVIIRRVQKVAVSTLTERSSLMCEQPTGTYVVPACIHLGMYER